MSTILRILQDQPGKYICLATANRTVGSPELTNFQHHWFKDLDEESLEEFLEEYSIHEVYFCPHKYSQKKATPEFAVPGVWLWADLDNMEPSIIPEELQPTLLVQTSRRCYQGYWRIENGEYSSELNRQLTRVLKADKGGWAANKLMRVIDTRNRKYRDRFFIKCVESSGQTYPVEHFDDWVSPDKIEKSPAKERKSLRYRLWKKTRRPRLRKMLAAKPDQVRLFGDRSNALANLAHMLMEEGCNEDEIYDLIATSPFNKFAGRKDEAKRLGDIVDNALSKIDIDELLEPDEEEMTFGALESVDLLKTKKRPIEWVYEPYLARRHLTLFDGDPGAGKSTFMQWMVATLLMNKGPRDKDKNAMPLPKGRLPDMVKSPKVLAFDFENPLAEIGLQRYEDILGHYEGNGYDALHKYMAGRFVQITTPVSLLTEEGFERIKATVRKHRPDLIVFDMLANYTTQVDSNSSNDANEVMNRLGILATMLDKGTSVLALRHKRKSSAKGSSNHLMDGMGSISYVGRARSVIAVCEDKEDPKVKYFYMTKCNFAKFPPVVQYELKDLDDYQIPDGHFVTNRMIPLIHGYIDMTTKDIEQGNSSSEKANLDQVKNFIDAQWAQVTMEGKSYIDAKALLKEARKQGIEWFGETGDDALKALFRRVLPQCGLRFWGGGRSQKSLRVIAKESRNKIS